MIPIEALSVEQREAIEKSYLESLTEEMGFNVDPDAFDIMQGLVRQGRVSPDWFRRNYENTERWLKAQREIGFLE